jgi:cob(I)alamin adenosyltransferase
LRLNETEATPEMVKLFLNRLSDYLFTLGRLLSLELGNEEVKWTV